MVYVGVQWPIISSYVAVQALIINTNLGAETVLMASTEGYLEPHGFVGSQVTLDRAVSQEPAKKRRAWGLT